MVKFLTSTRYLSSEGNFISSFVGCPRIFSFPQTGYWVWPFLTLFVHMRLDIRPGLLQCSLNTGYNWPPQYSTKKKKKRKRMTHSCKFQILIKLACFQYRNPNVSKVLHIHFVIFLTNGTNKKIKYQKT